MKTMINFADNNRTTTFFRDLEIYKIKIAYRIMEYLAPDSVFKPDNLNKDIMNLLLQGRFPIAYGMIKNELIDDIDLGSHNSEDVENEAIGLMQYLLPIYKKGIQTNKEQRRIQLLEELKELEDK